MADGSKHGECAPRVRGVDYHQGSGKWRARIRVDKKDHNLGLFETHADAVAARQAAEVRLLPNPIDPEIARKRLLDRVQELYEQNGLVAFSSAFLEAQPDALYAKLRDAGLKQEVLLTELDLGDEYSDWSDANRTYAGKPRPRWTWELAVSEATKIKEQEGDLPTLEWFRSNGHSSLASAVFKSGHTWEQLREAVGCFATSHYKESRNGMRWRSGPEANLSNFLHARNIPHKRGEQYDESYAAVSDRARGHFDLHFETPGGRWIDVEVWGEGLGGQSSERYRETREFKENWLASNPNFLGVEYRDCLIESRLVDILRPYIGDIEPTNFEKASDHFIETAHWSNADELLATCRQIAAGMPDGLFPTESWLRKRGKYADRDGPAYNTLAIRITHWLGGFRNLRKLLGQEEASTIKWTSDRIIEAWRAFESHYGYPPSQGSHRHKNGAPIEQRREAAKIYRAASAHGVLKKCRPPRKGRAIKWTMERTTDAWRTFVTEHGRTPSQCMSAFQRARLSEEVCAEATRIYGAANRLGLIDQLRRS